MLPDARHHLRRSKRKHVLLSMADRLTRWQEEHDLNDTPTAHKTTFFIENAMEPPSHYRPVTFQTSQPSLHLLKHLLPSLVRVRDRLHQYRPSAAAGVPTATDSSPIYR